MRAFYYLVPGVSRRYFCGGLLATLRTAALSNSVAETEVITYAERSAEHLFLDDVLADRNVQLSQVIFVLVWGPDIASLHARLKSHPCVRYAHSCAPNHEPALPIPTLCVSRYTLGSVCARKLGAPAYLLPNVVEESFKNENGVRDIDLLVLERKSSGYLLALCESLGARHHVKIVSGHVADVPALFNSARIYAFDSTDYWQQHELTEGFGLQPLEAMACGCDVFSSANHALADYLTPLQNCQLFTGEMAIDRHRIQEHLSEPLPKYPSTVVESYRPAAIASHMRRVYADINRYFDENQGLNRDD